MDLQMVLIAAGIALLVLLTLCLSMVCKKHNKARENQRQAARRVREEALDRALSNSIGAVPAAGRGKIRRPFRVDYSQGEKNAKKQNEDVRMYQLTEITELSERRYMFRRSEQLYIGRQFGSICILPGPGASEQAYCRLFDYQNEIFVRSMGNERILLTRRGKQAVVDNNGLKLHTGDMLSIGDTIYKIDL